MSRQNEELERVLSKTENAIVQFVTNRRRTFTGPELYAAVRAKVPSIAPGSPDRIMRHLRARGVISVRLIDRRNSIYQSDTVTASTK